MQSFGGAISHLSEVPAHLLEEKYGMLPGYGEGPGSRVRNPGRWPTHPPVIDPRRVPTGGSGSTGIGVLDYNPTSNQGYSASQLAQVTDPDATMASVARSQHERYIRNFRGFEEALIAAKDDTSLIDAAKKDAPEQARIAREVAERQRSRYGLTQTAVEARETQRASQRGEAINLAGGVNNARLAQRDANTRLISDLINIGQGVNRSSLSQLGAAGENAVARKNAYQQAKSAHKQQTYSMIGTAGAMLAAFLI